MEVTFTKLGGGRYSLTVLRSVGPRLATRNGPGRSFLPHDVAHFLVEAEAGIAGGIFGQIAAGDNNILWPEDPDERRRQSRREKTPSAQEKLDTARSERIVRAFVPFWDHRRGLSDEVPLWWSPQLLEGIGEPLTTRLVARFDEFADRWGSLADGSGLTLPWPAELRRPPRHSPWLGGESSKRRSSAAGRRAG